MNFIKKYIILLAVILFSCAVKSPPTGGAEDMKSPYIVDISPFNNAINLMDRENIEVTFNEMIDPNSMKSSIEIIPAIDININRYGKKIVIKPKDKWPSDTVFKIRISRGVSDYFGNKLESSKILTYSTSDQTFNGIIEGEIVNNDLESISMVGLYKVIDNNFVYYSVIENDIDNKYIFNNVANGEYVVLAVQNEIKDIFKDIRKYHYGFHSKTISITDDNNRFNNVDIMFSFPSYRDDIVSLNSFNNFYGEIEFIRSDKVFLINEVLNKDSYKDIESYILYDNSLDSIDIDYLMNNYIENYTIDSKYKLNMMLADSIAPQINDSYFDESNFIIEFSEPVYMSNTTYPFYLVNEIDTTFLNYGYLNPFTIQVENLELSDNQIYINNLLITDYSENKNILTEDKLNLISSLPKSVVSGGDISGKINYNGNNNIIVEIKSTISNDYKRLMIDNSGVFTFDNIAPGKYSILAYEHINPVTDYYFNGSFEPFKLGARFGLYNQIIEVRANWDIEGVNFNINE